MFLLGSLIGEIASQKVLEAYKGILPEPPKKGWEGSVRAKIYLTVRKTIRTGVNNKDIEKYFFVL